MISLKFCSILFLTVAFFTCKGKLHPKKVKPFIVERKVLKADTVITSAVLFNGNIICHLRNDKVFVLDSLLNRNDKLTDKFSNIKIDLLKSYNDSILIRVGEELYFLDKDFSLKNYNHNPNKYQFPYYNDSIYSVYACSAGEWGGAVFFLNKKTNKTYSYPARDVQQVFRFHDFFVVPSFLPHMGGFSDFLFIKDPTQLYELKEERQKTFCNWYTVVDSLKDKNHFDKLLPSGTRYYEDTFTTRTLTTFPYKDEIYSIYCTDKATILAKFENFKLVPVDTLLNKRLMFYTSYTHLFINESITAYNAAWSRGTESFQNTGLVFRKDNKISFIEFQTPHMYETN